MGSISNELLFFGGLGLALAAIIFLIVMLIVLHTKNKRLQVELDREYGDYRKLKSGKAGD